MLFPKRRAAHSIFDGANTMDRRYAKHYERLLLEQRDRYQEALQRFEAEEAEPQGVSAGDAVRGMKDIADAASDTQEQESDFVSMNRLSARLAEVDEALAVLRKSPERFGKCKDCGRAIEAARLELVPWSERCARCAQRSDGALISRTTS
jgi:RNA polymerase-binding transcription factor DksA